MAAKQSLGKSVKVVFKLKTANNSSGLIFPNAFPINVFHDPIKFSASTYRIEYAFYVIQRQEQQWQH